MSITIEKKTFANSSGIAVCNAFREWILTQIPELTLFKTGTISGSNWWIYKFGDTDYGLSFYNYTSNTWYLSTLTGITDNTTGANKSYTIANVVVQENNLDIYKVGAIVIKTTNGIIIQGMDYAGTPYSSFIYLGKTESTIKGQIVVVGYFSKASYIIISQGSTSISYADNDISPFHFKIENETPATWRNGALTAIQPSGTKYGTAGSIVASAIYGVTSSTWMEPIRIDAFYTIQGKQWPPYHEEVTLGGRTMLRIANNIAIEK